MVRKQEAFIPYHTETKLQNMSIKTGLMRSADFFEARSDRTAIARNILLAQQTELCLVFADMSVAESGCHTHSSSAVWQTLISSRLLGDLLRAPFQ